MKAPGARAPIDELLEGVPAGERRALAEGFVRRMRPLLGRLVERSGAEQLKEALSSRTEVGSLARILAEIAGEPDVRSLDPLAVAFARGAEYQQVMLEQAGGAWGVSEVVEHLGVSRQAIDKRRKRGTLLAVESASGYLYPAFQFTETSRKPRSWRRCCGIRSTGSSPGRPTSRSATWPRCRHSRSCVVVQFDEPGLRTLGATLAVLGTRDYALPHAWSRALWEHPGAPDGILYPCRHDNSTTAVALVERSGAKIRLLETHSLAREARSLGDMFVRYRFGVVA